MLIFLLSSDRDFFQKCIYKGMIIKRVVPYRFPHRYLLEVSSALLKYHIILKKKIDLNYFRYNFQLV